MKRITPEESAYIAGFIDGEGSLQIQCRLHRNIVNEKENTWLGYSIFLDVGQTQIEILEYLKDVCESGCIHKKNQYGNRKQAWCFRLAGKNAQELIGQIRPYLKVKSKIADVFLQFPMNGRERRENNVEKQKLFLMAKELNYRGLKKV
jgi:hypothetical protein